MSAVPFSVLGHEFFSEPAADGEVADDGFAVSVDFLDDFVWKCMVWMRRHLCEGAEV